jgi:hypothetical protein
VTSSRKSVSITKTKDYGGAGVRSTSSGFLRLREVVRNETINAS